MTAVKEPILFLKLINNLAFIEKKKIKRTNRQQMPFYEHY